MKELAPLARPLGDVEYMYWLLDQVAGTNFAVVVEVEGELPVASVRASLDGIQARCPSLRCALELREHGPSFVPCDSPVELRELRPDGDWLQSVEALQRERFDLGEGPLLRVLYCGSDGDTRLAFVFHHAIADASCGCELAHAIFLEARSDALGEASSSVTFLDATPVEGRLDARFRGFSGTMRLAWHLVRKLASGVFRGLPRMEQHDGLVPILERSDHFLPHAFTVDFTGALVAQARTQKASVHGALCAAQLLALQEPFSRPTSLGLLSLVSLRERLSAPVESHAMGPTIGFVSTTHKLRKGADFWSLAREVSRDSRRFLEGGEGHLLLPFMGRELKSKALHLKPLERAGKHFDRMERLAPASSVVSNVGRLPYPRQEGAFGLKGLHFFVALSGSARFGSSAATCCGRLFWNFSYSSPVLSKERAQAYALAACEALKQAVG